MKCPFCDNDSTRVVSVAENKEGIRVRRRECLSEDCKERVTTYEVSQLSMSNILMKHFPEDIVKRMEIALAMEFPEKGEVVEKRLFDFYFENVSDF